jgi:hypothetical protein
MTIKLGGLTVENSKTEVTEERAGKSEPESSSEAGTLAKKEPESSKAPSKGSNEFTDVTEEDSVGGCIIVGYHQKPKGK